MSAGRSSLREVRNPILGLPAAARLAELDPQARRILDELLRDLAIDARERAESAWAKRKGPMAAYWQAASVYAKHIRAAVRASGKVSRR